MVGLESTPSGCPGSAKNFRSTVITAVTFATEACLSPVSRGGITTFPGSAASAMFLVTAITATVASALRLK
jgi:hypothetical protein